MPVSFLFLFISSQLYIVLKFLYKYSGGVVFVDSIFFNKVLTGLIFGVFESTYKGLVSGVFLYSLLFSNTSSGVD